MEAGWRAHDGGRMEAKAKSRAGHKALVVTAQQSTSLDSAGHTRRMPCRGHHTRVAWCMRLVRGPKATPHSRMRCHDGSSALLPSVINVADTRRFAE